MIANERAIEQTHSRQVRGSLTKQAGIAVSIELKQAIEKTQQLLTREFGCDHAYTVVGRGHIIAASNYRDGHIEPETF